MATQKRVLVSVLAAVCSGACAPSTVSPPSTEEVARQTAPASGAESFQSVADRLYWDHFGFRPHEAIGLGHHQYDGRVPDRSPEAIAEEIDRLAAARRELEGIDPARLSEPDRLDREILMAEIRKEQFGLVQLRWPQSSPVYYLLSDFSLAPYVDRDYAPLEQRARGLLTACRQAPVYYRHMRANLDESLTRPQVLVGTMIAGGTISFVDQVVRAEMSRLPAVELRGEIDQCLDGVVTALEEVRADLESRMPKATDDFALGEELFLEMLSETQGIEVDLETLERIGRADLERNLAAIEAAARAIDPDRPLREVVAEAARDKPDDVLAAATEQVERMRSFVVEHRIAEIPGGDVVEVRPSPPHKRANIAMLSSAGPFEQRDLPSFYYISPPDPSWPEEKQQSYLPSRADLLFLSIHEVWPGHFLQGRFIATQGSKIMKSFGSYATSEGWAHYAEEMMWDAGVGDGDPRVHIGELKNALLRNVRFMVALGLHTGGMTVDEAAAMFREVAFADPGNARQQALRGTGDPMYLSYTLGKLAILKLRDDWRGEQGDAYSLEAFHNELLRHGNAPLGVIRRSMLGEDAGPVL